MHKVYLRSVPISGLITSVCVVCHPTMCTSLASMFTTRKHSRNENTKPSKGHCRMANMTIIIWINHTATPYTGSHLTVILATDTMAASGEMVARISLTPSLLVPSDCVKAEYFWSPDKMPSAAELGELQVSAIIASVFPASALRRDVADSDPTFVVCIVHGESKRRVTRIHNMRYWQTHHVHTHICEIKNNLDLVWDAVCLEQ